jgi:hypothetical protein
MAWLLQVLESLLMTGSHGVDNGVDNGEADESKETDEKEDGKGGVTD